MIQPFPDFYLKRISCIRIFSRSVAQWRAYCEYTERIFSFFPPYIYFFWLYFFHFFRNHHTIFPSTWKRSTLRPTRLRKKGKSGLHSEMFFYMAAKSARERGKAVQKKKNRIKNKAEFGKKNNRGVSEKSIFGSRLMDPGSL